MLVCGFLGLSVDLSGSVVDSGGVLGEIFSSFWWDFFFWIGGGGGGVTRVSHAGSGGVGF